MRNWTRDENDKLFLGCRAGLPIDFIADQLGRDPDEVERRARLLKLHVTKRDEDEAA